MRARSGVDTADFAARLQALMAPPAPESPAQNVAETVVAAKVRRRGHRGLASAVEAPVDETITAEADR